MTSLYETLGVPPTASKAEIRRAAKRKKQRLHPDRPGGDEAAFKAVGQAQKLLCDDSARARYDSTGSTEDRPEELTDEMHAISILGKLFIAVLEKDDGGGDLLYAVKAEIAKGMREGPIAIAATKRKLTKAERVLRKNLKQSAGKPGYLQNSLTSHIQHLRTTIEQMELAQRIGPLMLEILKDYKWDGDKTNYTFQQMYPQQMIQDIFNNIGG